MIFVNEEVCEIVLIIAVLLYSYGSTNYVFSAAVFFFIYQSFDVKCLLLSWGSCVYIIVRIMVPCIY